MKKIFLLVKEDLDFSKEEVISLYKPKAYEIIEDLLIFETDKDFSDRLALTKKIYDLITITENIDESIRDIDWNQIIKGSFRVKCDDSSLEKELATTIYSKLDSPKVDLKNPDGFIQIFLRDETFFISILDTMVSTDWKLRKPHMKPELSPTSLNPRIARAMINLAEKPKGRMCDPFCGTGGILVEAGLMHHRSIGFDIDEISLKKAKINLDHYGIEGYHLFNDDALNNDKKVDFVVTDLPYGMNSRISKGLEELYISFFEKYYDLCDIMIVGLPDFIKHDGLIGKWKIDKEFTLYLHRSLSKNILKLKKYQSL